jgi:hypothetical protein
MTKSVSLLMLALALDSVACVAQSTLGTDPVGAAGTPTVFTTQPVSIATPDGGFVCGPETGDVYAGCPADPSGAADGTPCALPTRTVCDYQTGTSAVSCSCMPTAFGNRWSGASIGDAVADCPSVRPAHGASCGATDFGRTCNYLRTPACTCAADLNAPYRRGITCSCREDLGAWVCANDGQDGPLSLPATPDAGASGGLPPFDESPCYGSPIALPAPPLDESKIINQLSNAEVAIWCGWYVAHNQDGGLAPASAPPWGRLLLVWRAGRSAGDVHRRRAGGSVRAARAPRIVSGHCAGARRLLPDDGERVRSGGQWLRDTEELSELPADRRPDRQFAARPVRGLPGSRSIAAGARTTSRNGRFGPHSAPWALLAPAPVRMVIRPWVTNLRSRCASRRIKNRSRSTKTTARNRRRRPASRWSRRRNRPGAQGLVLPRPKNR